MVVGSVTVIERFVWAINVNDDAGTTDQKWVLTVEVELSWVDIADAEEVIEGIVVFLLSITNKNIAKKIVNLVSKIHFYLIDTIRMCYFDNYIIFNSIELISYII